MQGIRKFSFRRAAITAAAVCSLVALGGCVVYPVDGYRDGGYGYRGHGHGGYHHGYGYGGYGRYEWRGRDRHYW